MTYIPDRFDINMFIKGSLLTFAEKFLDLKKEELNLKRTAEKTKAFLRNAHGNHQPGAFAQFEEVWKHFEEQ